MSLTAAVGMSHLLPAPGESDLGDAYRHGTTATFGPPESSRGARRERWGLRARVIRPAVRPTAAPLVPGAIPTDRDVPPTSACLQVVGKPTAALQQALGVAGCVHVPTGGEARQGGRAGH